MFDVLVHAVTGRKSVPATKAEDPDLQEQCSKSGTTKLVYGSNSIAGKPPLLIKIAKGSKGVVLHCASHYSHWLQLSPSHPHRLLSQVVAVFFCYVNSTRPTSAF